MIGFFALAAPENEDAVKLFHERVAPLLVKNCLECHNANTHKGGLSLETRAEALRGGEEGPAIVAGKPLDSPLFTKIVPTAHDAPEMPQNKPPLSADQAAVVRRWIEAGAPWPMEIMLKERSKADSSFWSFQPLANVEIPVDANPTADRCANPIDAFILAKLRPKGLAMNPPAEPREFIRRATYDLIGLPPSYEEVESFAKACVENRAAAVRQLIDRLLASPHYGERWGRHWLDVVRFGESRGYERNEIITNLWPFRDYVIRSFNEDKPSDAFIHEHLAGDVIGAGRPEVEIGSAFLVAGPYDDVGNQDPIAAAQIRADQMDEMIRATAEAFLGLTLGCCRCHDHKFDPLLQRDYYAMYGTFAGMLHGAREVATPQQVAERDALIKPLADAKRKLEEQRETLQAQLAERAKAREVTERVLWKRPRASRYGTEETFPAVEGRFIRLKVEGTDSADPKQTQFRLDEFEVWTDESRPRNVALASSGAQAFGAAREAKDFSGAYGPALAIDGKFGERWLAGGDELRIALARPERIGRVFFSSDRPQALGENYALTTFVGDYRIEVSTDGEHWREVANSFDRQPPTDLRKLARLIEIVTTDDDRQRLAELDRGLANVEARINTVPPLAQWWIGKRQAAPGPFPMFLGGSPQRKGASVAPASLSVFEGRPSSYSLDAERPEADRRLALANWITASDNPLTPRVLVNRVWHYHFGKGIVDTPSDFGYMGGRPSHPELLDWLARRLQSDGWRLMPLHRLIMTSQAYQQSAAFRPDAARIDGDDRLLWRFTPRRLSAEEIRDTLLTVAEKLDPRMGGPGFRLYEYQQDNVATYVPLDVHGPETYRRAVYHQSARAAPVDVLSDFDAPDPATAEPRRASTTTALQSLTLLNHRFTLDMAQAFAERLQRESGGTGKDDSKPQIRRAFAIAFQREPGEEELAAGLRLVESHGLRAFCRALLNTNELLYLE